MTPFEILKHTPKTNCGQCGHPTCLAFAAAVAKSGESVDKCPFIERQGLTIAAAPGHALDDLLHQHDLALVEHLKGKVAGLDFAAIATRLGARGELQDGCPALSFRYLGQQVRLSREGILLGGLPPDDPRDQILLYNYVHSQGGEKPREDWVGLESLPNSISKVRTLATYCENRLAELFDQTPVERVAEAVARLDGTMRQEATATLAAVIPVLPHLPQQLLFWAAEPEDGFAARAKVLFDREVLHFLDLESLVFSAERMSDRFAALLR
ncbi:MAG: DUF3786 domain-containing protein [Thermodesulfobacteriota bacterium]